MSRFASAGAPAFLCALALAGAPEAVRAQESGALSEVVVALPWSAAAVLAIGVKGDQDPRAAGGLAKLLRGALSGPEVEVERVFGYSSEIALARVPENALDQARRRLAGALALREESAEAQGGQRAARMDEAARAGSPEHGFRMLLDSAFFSGRRSPSGIARVAVRRERPNEARDQIASPSFRLPARPSCPSEPKLAARTADFVTTWMAFLVRLGPEATLMDALALRYLTQSRLEKAPGEGLFEARAEVGPGGDILAWVSVDARDQDAWRRRLAEMFQEWTQGNAALEKTRPELEAARAARSLKLSSPAGVAVETLEAILAGANPVDARALWRAELPAATDFAEAMKGGCVARIVVYGPS